MKGTRVVRHPRQVDAAEVETPPLRGVRILDFTRILSGPYCTLLLADMGAEVIKVESDRGDETRGWGPPFLDDDERISAYFGALNRGKKSIVLDLRSPQTRELLKRLVARVDVVIENFRPGVAERLGLDWQTLQRANQRLVFCSISGFGDKGPYAELPGTEIVVEAMSGLMEITGPEGGEPVRFGIAMTDIATGLTASTRILAALMRARETGRGSRIQCSLYATALAALSTSVAAYTVSGIEPRRWGSHHPSIVPYGGFPTSDGRIITGVVGDTSWPPFCRALGLDSLAEDERFEKNADRVAHRGELLEILSQRFAEKPTMHWVDLLSERGLLAAPIRSVGQALADHATHGMGILVSLDGYDGVLTIRLDGAAASDCPEAVPRLGEHTDQILAELNGLSSNRMSSLASQQT